MTEQQPATPAPETPQTPVQPAAESPKPQPPGDKQPPWGKPENFDADEAWKTIQNLRREKGGPDPTLKAELDQLRQQQTQQRDALATALGIKPEETSDTDKLAGQIQALQAQIVSSERRALAVEFKVPEAMLTATDAEAMRKQAEDLVEFAQGSHYAALAAASQPPPPAFQQNPGQGQGNTPPSSEAMADAEYEKYYPPATAQR